MITIKLHLVNEDPVMGEIDTLPDPAAVSLHVKHPRRGDGKDVHYLEQNVSSVVWPFHKINFIEIMPGEEEEILSFVRE